MKDQSLEIPADVRELVENTVYQVEKAFIYFFQAAKVPYPSPGDMAINLAERNMTVAFEFARKLARAKDLQETIALQAEFMRTQVELASEFMRELTPK
jgi:hypothetical protein